MTEKILYIIYVVVGAIIWLFFSLWFLKRSFKKYSVPAQINSNQESKAVKKKKPVPKKT